MNERTITLLITILKLDIPGSVADIKAPNRRHSKKSKSLSTVANLVKAYMVDLDKQKRTIP